MILTYALANTNMDVDDHDDIRSENDESMNQNQYIGYGEEQVNVNPFYVMQPSRNNVNSSSNFLYSGINVNQINNSSFLNRRSKELFKITLGNRDYRYFNYNFSDDEEELFEDDDDEIDHRTFPLKIDWKDYYENKEVFSKINM